MSGNCPRFMIAGTGSGCGKTTITSAILQAMVYRKQRPAAFKCGPDYIDPMFHSQVIGVPSRNLDLFFCAPSVVRASLKAHSAGADIALIEGVMGFYDGLGGTTAAASSHDLSEQTETPVVLVVSPQGMSLSVAALLKGYLTFAPNRIKGVIFNGVSASAYQMFRSIVEEQTGLRAFGFLPRMEEAAFESRHLGLIPAAEVAGLQSKLRRLAEQAEKTIDLDGLMALEKTAPSLHDHLPQPKAEARTAVRIGIARDPAFCFYYADNLDVLRLLGAELVPFSPLNDRALPDRLDGLYLGGGYPELHTETLSSNRTMRQSIRQAIGNGLPTIAECGGFLYLHETLNDAPMAGVFPAQANLSKRLQPFGYITLTAQKDCLLLSKGESIRAHEFHYVVSSAQGQDCIAQKPLSGRSWPCVHGTETLFAGFPHLYFYANMTCAERFIERCRQYQEGQLR